MAAHSLPKDIQAEEVTQAMCIFAHGCSVCVCQLGLDGLGTGVIGRCFLPQKSLGILSAITVPEEQSKWDLLGGGSSQMPLGPGASGSGGGRNCLF